MAMEELGYSPKKQGVIPFKWEIIPGVPKQQLHVHDQKPLLPPLEFRKPSLEPPLTPPHLQQQKQLIIKLKPPPALLAKSYPSSEPRGNSFRSNPRSRSDRWTSDNSTPAIVSTGCLIGSWFRRKRRVPRPESEPGCNSELQVMGRWSVTSRKSLSTFRSSMSPRPESEPDWAGFGLF